MKVATTLTQTLRPPSVPLIAVDPYFSVWSAVDRLHDASTTHWTNKPNGMAGIIRIDGKARRFMGLTGSSGHAGSREELPAMEQIGVKVEPLTSTYLFESDGVRLEAAFMTPLLLDDLELLSRPASYMTFRASSVDGKPHRVQLYVDLTAELCVNTTDQPVTWSRAEAGDRLAAMRIGTEEQPVLRRIGDDTRIDWGYVYLAAPRTEGLQTAIHSCQMRLRFAETGRLPDRDDESCPREAADDTVAMAAVFDLGDIGGEPASRYVIAAYDDVHSIEYFGRPLDAYWRRTGMTFEAMLNLAAEQYGELAERGAAFNEKLIRESGEAGGEKFADILSLAYRQAIAAHKLVAGERGELLFFSKENFSNGCIATVDVSYPSIPLFLYGNPELVKGMMRPIFKYAASEQWTFDFAPHDVGCYPAANGQVYGENKLENQMPIEECGNMLIMAAAVSLYEGNAEFAREHWALLTRWAEYLKEHGMDPDNQLCTDDFAGHLAHNANLSIKAIIGLGGYSILCSMLGEPEGEVYLALAKEMAGRWAEMAGAGDHYKLTFDSAPDTWSLKYNLVWDRLFGLHLFPEDIAEDEVRHYIAAQNKYGTPLDSRSSYTKADWLVWSAAMANTKEEFAQIVEPLWHFLNETPSRVPFTDWYDTISGKQIGFQNRSVVGGLFLPLLRAF